MEKKLLFAVGCLISVSLFSGCTANNSTDYISKPKNSYSNTNEDTSLPKEKFTIIKNQDMNTDMLTALEFIKQHRGYGIISEDENLYNIFIGSGEKNTGGYTIEVINVENKDGKTIITVREISPSKDQMVTQAITYPYVVISISKNIVQNVVVVNTEGELFDDINNESGENDM